MSLHDQTDPLTHRKQCLVELQNQKQEQKTLDKMAEGAVSNEIVMRILNELVTARRSRLLVNNIGAITDLPILLLGRSTAAQSLYAMCTQAVLETSLIRLDIKFSKNHAQLPPFYTNLPHDVRHLEIFSEMNISQGCTRYPSEIFRLANSMASLKSQLPHLHTLKLALFIDILQEPLTSPGHWSSWKCIAGFGKMTTYEGALGRLIQALRDHGPGRKKYVQLSHGIRETMRQYEPFSDEAEIGGERDAERVISDIITESVHREGEDTVRDATWKMMVKAKNEGRKVVAYTQGQAQITNWPW